MCIREDGLINKFLKKGKKKKSMSFLYPKNLCLIELVDVRVTSLTYSVKIIM